MNSGYIRRILELYLCLLVFLQHPGWINTLVDNSLSPISGEYCVHETLQASCGLNEVIVVERAHYGREQIGRCIPDDYGMTQFMGCSQDVITLADKKCSGRQSCSLLSGGADFVSFDPCHNKQLSNYLDITYTCMQVIPHSQCGRGEESWITSPSRGTISSYSSQQGGCGGADQPWVLRAGEGQRIAITLIDFAHNDDNFMISGTCVVYAIIKEPSAQTTETVCGGREKETLVYRSLGSTVDIQVRSSDERQFLLSYEFVGCSDPAMRPGMRFTRRGVKGVWTCEEGGEQFLVECEGSSWTGDSGECTDKPIDIVRPMTSSPSSGGIHQAFNAPLNSFSWEMILIMVAIVTVGMVLCVLIVGIVCLKKSRLETPRTILVPPPEDMYGMYDIPRRPSGRSVIPKPDESYYQSLPRPTTNPRAKSIEDGVSPRDGRYYRPAWDRSLPPPPPTQGPYDA